MKKLLTKLILMLVLAVGDWAPFLAKKGLAHLGPLKPARELLGGRLRFAISGGAPLDEEVAELFEAVGAPIYQGYGLTETSPVLATNSPDHQRIGSVGKPLSEVELRIAEDCEILVRGPGVMQGYWQNPGATAESINDFRCASLSRRRSARPSAGTPSTTSNP